MGGVGSKGKITPGNRFIKRGLGWVEVRHRGCLWEEGAKKESSSGGEEWPFIRDVVHVQEGAMAVSHL